MSGPSETLRGGLRTPIGSAGGEDETHEGLDGSDTRSPLGMLPPDAILLAQAGGTLPTPTAPKISTPIPSGAKRKRNGTYALSVGIVDVTILKDTRTTLKKWRNRAHTRLGVKYTTPSYRYSGTKITGFSPPTVTMTIQTTYGPGSSPSDMSGYGKGKTLRDHEGHHGTDYLDFIAANPITFAGKNGMTLTEFNEAVNEFVDEVKGYAKKAEKKSLKETDCTGIKASFCK